MTRLYSVKRVRVRYSFLVEFRQRERFEPMDPLHFILAKLPRRTTGLLGCVEP